VASAESAGADRLAMVAAEVTTYRLDLPRWDIGPRVPCRTKDGQLKRTAAGKVVTRMQRPIWSALTGNARSGHWAQRHSATKKVITAVITAARDAEVTAGAHLTVQLVWSPGDNRHADEDNLWPLLKVLADGLARGPRKDLPGLRLVPDDTAEWMTKMAPQIARPPAPPGLWLEVTVRP
jgi:hypothetical protein